MIAQVSDLSFILDLCIATFGAGGQRTPAAGGIGCCRKAPLVAYECR